MMNETYDIIEDYKKQGEMFNITGESRNPIYISDFTDDDLLKEYDIIYQTEKLHWKEEWLFIFKDAYKKRRKQKLEKLCLIKEIK